MKYQFQEKEYQFHRYPKTDNKSLQPWNAGDELTLSFLEENNLLHKNGCLFNDRFGFLACVLPQSKSILDYKSQERALVQNAEQNGLSAAELRKEYILGEIGEMFDFSVIKVPKSVEHFELYLTQIKNNIGESGRVVCAFMTKYFTPQILEIASKHFHSVEQSKAWKKARLLILSQPKQGVEVAEHKVVPNAFGDDLLQYSGVFASKGIDIGTRFLLENFTLKPDEVITLDLASGNGIIAKTLGERMPQAELHLLDDSHLAVESSKLNLKNSNSFFYCNDTLADMQPNYFDLIISNPPFHFGHETNIEVSLALFAESKNYLKDGGRLVIVSNKHLNYKIHLQKLFTTARNLEENDKFEIIECVK